MCLENTEIDKYSLFSLNLLRERCTGTVNVNANSKDDGFTSEWSSVP